VLGVADNLLMLLMSRERRRVTEMSQYSLRMLKMLWRLVGVEAGR
jgi:hypothetical protein